MSVSIMYQTSEGSLYFTFEEAEIADKIEQAGVYLDTWKKDQIIQALTSTPVKEPTDETITDNQD